MKDKELLAATDAIIKHLLSQGIKQVTTSFTLKGDDTNYHMELTCLLAVKKIEEVIVN